MNNHHLEKLCQRYLSEKNIASATVKSYKIAFRKYIAYLKEHDIEYAKTSDVIQYRERQRALGWSSQYIYIHISALKGLYRYLSINQRRLDLPIQYAYNIMTPIKNETIKPRITKPILTIEQAKQMILHTKNNRKSIWHYRDHAIIYLMITTGLRSIEIVHAKRKDYKNVQGKQLLYIQRKGIKENDEYVKIPKGAGEAITDYLNQRIDNNPYLFISHKKVSKKGYLSRVFFIDMFHRVLKDCGLVGIGITPHCLRHTAATFNLLRGGSLEQTRQLMRHVNIQSTLVYANYIERMKDDSEAQIEKLILSEDASHVTEEDALSFLE